MRRNDCPCRHHGFQSQSWSNACRWRIGGRANNGASPLSNPTMLLPRRRTSSSRMSRARVWRFPGLFDRTAPLRGRRLLSQHQLARAEDIRDVARSAIRRRRLTTTIKVCPRLVTVSYNEAGRLLDGGEQRRRSAVAAGNPGMDAALRGRTLPARAQAQVAPQPALRARRRRRSVGEARAMTPKPDPSAAPQERLSLQALVAPQARRGPHRTTGVTAGAPRAPSTATPAPAQPRAPASAARAVAAGRDADARVRFHGVLSAAGQGRRGAQARGAEATVARSAIQRHGRARHLRRRLHAIRSDPG